MASGGRESNVFSSDEESLRVGKRRRRPKAIVSSDSDDSDFEVRQRKSKPLDCVSDEESNQNEATYSSEPRFCSNAEEFSINENSDNEQSEKCAICLSKFNGQDIATPETCDHMFCLECLQEWAKNVNTCPIDRLKFNLILIRHHKEEKIFKRIFVNCPELPWLYESESDSNVQTEISSCGFCGEHDNEDSLLPCHECHKTFHIDCLLIPPPIQLSSSNRLCPNCTSYIRIKRLKRRLDLHDRNSVSSALGTTYSEGFNHHAYSRGIRRLHQKTQELIQRLKRRIVISSSESSEDEVEYSSHSPVRMFQDQISSKSRCPFIQKRRREVCHSQNQTLISSTASATSNSELYSVDSDDGIGNMRYDSYDRVLIHQGHPSSTSRNFSTRQTSYKMFVSDCPSENYDVVGTILQSQTLLHRSDVLTLKRDGSLLVTSNVTSDSPLNSPSATSSINDAETNTENNSFVKSSVFDNKSVLPYSGGAVYNQRPMNPSQNTNSKYRETPRENYSCSSSTTSIDPSVDYDNGNISSRNTLDSSGNERYNNDNSCSSMIHKSFCGSSAADEIKKVSSGFKDSAKGHHSEDEVDIYSDIESVGDDDGACNTMEEVDDRMEPMKIPYKGDDSPSSNPDAASDSSDNELVIDEDMAAEEETDNRKEHFQLNNSDDKHEVENEQGNESDDSNASYSAPFHEQVDRETPDVQDENCSYVDSRSVEDSQLGEESSQETFQDSADPEAYKNGSGECNENKNGSDDEDKNESEYEDRNGSDDEEKNEFETEEKNDSEAGDDKNGSECDQESDMDVQVYEENSVESPKKSPRAGTSTPCSTVSSKHYDDDIKQGLGHCDNSISSENQEYCDTASDVELKKDKETIDASSMQVNENTCDSILQAEENENYQNENNSNYSFESVQQISESEEAMDSNIDASQTYSEADKKDLNDICSDSDMKSDYPEEGNTENDNVDYSENASTPLLDENILGHIENSPIHNTLGNTSQDFKSDHAEISDFDQKSDRTSPSACEYELAENDKANELGSEDYFESNTDKVPENSVDLGIEDISEAGSGDLDDDFADENMSFSEKKRQEYNDAEREDNSNFEGNDDDLDSKVSSKQLSDDAKYQTSQNSNQSFEDREEGEIIEDKPVCRPDRKHGSKFDFHDENEDYGELAPRVNISDLPRIPKIKRDREKDNVPEDIPIETKRTSVLGRVDLGGGDISWKRLSKHTRERSYRDGRPKDDRVLYRERESRKKDKKYSENEWRSDSKGSRRDDSKKQDSEKLRNEYESRSRKSDRKEKVTDWNYSERDKRNKSHKDKHKEKHKEKKEKNKHEKNKYSKDEVKYGREKAKDEDHYERELRFDKEQRFERIVYEKGKFKEKEHKSKHKDRKSDSKSGKDHSREKHKHVHTSDHFSDKQREREVRKIDDKLKIVVEQKEGRKEKSKHKDKKESKHDKKQVHHHEHRKKEIERSPYTELSSIESKEIFAKGDSIIINVNFNRTNSPKDLNAENVDSSFKDRKSIEDFELDEVISSTNEKGKGKHSLVDKGKILDTPLKRPTTPPERTNQVLSVSECYWQGGEDSDVNNSPSSEKSVEEVPVVEEENETMESADDFEGDNFSNSCNSTDVPESQIAIKEVASGSEETLEKTDKIDNTFIKETEPVVISKRRSPRSPSPPSPADNDSYDPCEPTRSPSPPPMPPAPPLPLGNPKPPPSPELPPLPPEPEPTDAIREEMLTHKQITSSEFIAVSSNSSQTVTANSQTSVVNSISLPSILLPPPSFLSHTATTNSLPTLSSLIPPRNFNFQVSHPNVIFPPNHVQQVIQGLVPTQIHAGTAIPPPPNPPSLPHMGSVPPPPPPPSAMALISSVRHPQINVRPALPNSLLQNLTMGHAVTLPQMHMSHLHHIPPNLSNPLNHQSPMLIPSQNQPVSLPVSIQNQPVSRVILPQNQILNHSTALQNQNNMLSKPPSNVASHQTLSNSTPQKSDKACPAEKSEVVDMEVDSPYSPGDSPSMDSLCDYSPTSSPLPSSPKNKDIFDTLLPSDHRTTDKNFQEASTKPEKSKRSESRGDGPSKKAKHDHKSDSNKVRHSVRMQITDKVKGRKEKKTEKRLDDSQLRILDELPSSAVELQVKEKFLEKLNRQERVVEELKLALKPYYKSRDVTKEEYKDILRKAVPKILHNKSGVINPRKVKTLVDCYIKKIKHSRKKSDKKKSSKLS